MRKQDILDECYRISDRINMMTDSYVYSGSTLSDQIRASIEEIKKLVGGLAEYRPGDKAALQTLIRDMASNSDTTGAKKVLIRLAGEMND